MDSKIWAIRPYRPTLAAVTLAIAVVLLASFFPYARVNTSAVVDLTLFHARTFRIGTLLGGICRIALNGAALILPLLLHVGMKMSAFQSGLLTFFLALGAVAIGPISTRGLRWFGFRRVLLWRAVLGAILISGFALAETGTPH